MNIKKSARAEFTIKKIEDALIYLLKRKDYSHIFVKDICKVACINRSSFYAHFEDINDLMNKVEAKFSNSISKIFDSFPYTHQQFVKMFEFIKENQNFYLAYLKSHDNFMEQADILRFNKKLKDNILVTTTFSNATLFYHLAFFSAGIKALCKVWLLTGSKESPEDMAKILFNEYRRGDL